MNFPFFIARRYLFSKKSTHVINIISSISVIGVAVATMALVIVLSVFNGFHDLVATLFTNFDPQLKVMPVEGKTAPADDPILTQIRQLPQVDVATETVEDQALAIYQDRQAMVTIKGVDDNFAELSHMGMVPSLSMPPICNMVRWASVLPRHLASVPSGMVSSRYMLRKRKDNST